MVAPDLKRSLGLRDVVLFNVVAVLSIREHGANFQIYADLQITGQGTDIHICPAFEL